MLETILKNLPKSPGIYQFFDKNDKIIYVGKSVNLKSRVNSYFNGKSKLNFAKKKMVGEISNIKTIVVNNEKESLVLETILIKKYKPKYNILMKDDKNYIYIKITDEAIPKILKTRIKNNKGIYFGPYISTNNVNNTLKVARKIFKFRTCNLEFEENSGNIKIKNSHGIRIPCIDYHTKYCSAPCKLQKENLENYFKDLENLKKFLNGNYAEIIANLNEKMLQKAKELKFEEANNLKKDIESLKILSENQIIREAVSGDFDVINYIEKYGNIYVSLASIRDSKIFDFKNYEIKANLEENIEEILVEFIQREIDIEGKQTLILPFEIDFGKYFKDLKVKSEIPKSGPKFELLKFVYKNCYEYAYKKHLNSLSTKGFTKQTMKNLLKMLNYKEINKNLIFECNDISHLSGTFTVASRSVIENGKTANNKYRKFNIKNLENLKIDDFGSMKEIMTRRLKELTEKQNLPDLIIIDGGIGQLNSVLKIVENYKNEISENTKLSEYLANLQIVSIAKKEEELFLPNLKDPIVLSKDSQELKLIQKIRDEAHRFAITFNREKRIKSEKKNLLESIPGIGAKTRKKLINEFGSIDNLKNIDKNDLNKIITKKQIEALENHGLI